MTQTNEDSSRKHGQESKKKVKDLVAWIETDTIDREGWRSAIMRRIVEHMKDGRVVDRGDRKPFLRFSFPRPRLATEVIVLLKQLQRGNDDGVSLQTHSQPFPLLAARLRASR